MDKIFSNLPNGPAPASEDTSEYHQRIRALIADARSYEETDLSVERQENQEYYYGLRPTLESTNDSDTVSAIPGDTDTDPGRSSIVSTDVRDTVMAVMPSLMRIFMGTDHPVEFIANQEADVPMAEQVTDYVSYILLEDNDGFLALHGVFKDALTVKAGIMKWWTDNTTEITEEEFTNITQEQLQTLLLDQPDVNVLEVEPNIKDQTLNVVLRWVKSKPEVKVCAVPPEEFRISRNARSVCTSQLLGHERIVLPSELVQMGYPEDFVADYAGSTTGFSVEEQLRRPGADWTMTKGVLYGEYYIRIDGDGDGIDELRNICTIGDDYTIVHDKVVDRARFAVFCPDPRSHTVIGDSLADLTKDIQKIKTNVIRGVLDSLAQSIFSRTVVNEVNTNIDDALNQEIGAIIRTTGDVNNAVAALTVPFVGQQAFPMLEYIDKIRQSRTGISEASKGIDPRALQSTNVMGIDAIVTGAQERIELIARILAETGMKDLFQGLLREVVNNPNVVRTVKLRGKWTPVDPSTFDPTMRVSVNPTIGKGSDLTRMLALQQVKDTQILVMSKFGLSNPMVTPIEFRNTLIDMLNLANIRNVSRYFKEITPEQMQAIAQMPKQPDPAVMLAQAEMEKVKAGTVKTIAEMDQRTAEEKEKDDFNRDKLTLDSVIKLIEITAKYKAQLDAAQVKADTEMVKAENQPPSSSNGSVH